MISLGITPSFRNAPDNSGAEASVTGALRHLGEVPAVPYWSAAWGSLVVPAGLISQRTLGSNPAAATVETEEETEEAERALDERATGPLNELHGDQRHSPERRAKRVQRDKEILEARVAGYSTAAIAEQFSISASRVRAIVSRLLRDQVGQPAEELIALYERRHEDLIRAWWREARGIGTDKDAKAAAIVDRALDRLAKLHRLDTLVIEHHGQTQDERAEAVGDAFDAYLRGIRDERARAEAGEEPAAEPAANGQG
jgi:hypothetical protein